jgi:hypothetical protein
MEVGLGQRCASPAFARAGSLRPRFARRLRMRNFSNATEGFVDGEERPKGASRTTHSAEATQFMLWMPRAGYGSVRRARKFS